MTNKDAGDDNIGYLYIMNREIYKHYYERGEMS